MSGDVVSITPGQAIDTKQKLDIFVGISGENAGATRLCMHKVVIPPGGRARAHLHRSHETTVYLLKGTVETHFGDGLRKSVVNSAGDFLFIPANVPHQPVNLSETEEAVAIVARSDPNEQESVEPYDPAVEDAAV
jgi:uncharacterized RmlC-like cupin family protein